MGGGGSLKKKKKKSFPFCFKTEDCKKTQTLQDKLAQEYKERITTIALQPQSTLNQLPQQYCVFQV